jgi:hypothetical protein
MLSAVSTEIGAAYIADSNAELPARGAFCVPRLSDVRSFEVFGHKSFEVWTVGFMWVRTA